MSRIGKHPCDPRVESSCRQTLTAKGGRHAEPAVSTSPATIPTARKQSPEQRKQAARAMGTTRALVSNMVTGVATGSPATSRSTGRLRAAVQGSTLNLQLGYSHDIPIRSPDVRSLRAPTGSRSPARSPARRQIAAEIAPSPA